MWFLIIWFLAIYVRIPAVKCDQNLFPLPDSERLDKVGIGEYLCPNISNFETYGDYRSPNFKILDIWFTKCTNSGCKTANEIANYIHGAYFV